MGSPMPGSKKVVLAPTPKTKVVPNKLRVDPPGGLVPNKLRVDPPAGLQPNRLVSNMQTTQKAKTSSFKLNPYTPIKKAIQVNKVYKTY